MLMRGKTIALWFGLIAAALVSVDQTALSEPVRLARADLELRRPAVAALPAPSAPPAGTAGPGSVTVNVADEAVLKEAMQRGMVEFIQRNYPSHIRIAMRSLQNGEGRVHEQLEDGVEFLKEFAQGPVTIEGALREIGGALRYVITGTIRGVEGHPKATLRFETYPGLMRPVTNVALDEDGDGKVDEESTGFCRLDRVRDWIEQQLHT